MTDPDTASQAVLDFAFAKWITGMQINFGCVLQIGRIGHLKKRRFQGSLKNDVSSDEPI